jgi:crotonobetainyl-CoA:carnitine CoA-transferase CaiB-like acyl-CoA transferase
MTDAPLAPPLAGLKILDLTRLLPGPFCTHLLATLGADVIKVEDPGGGDYLRYLPPQRDGENVQFRMLNCGKRSIVLDLKNEAGREVLRRLFATYDILFESFRPGVLDRLGLGYAQLKDEFPALIFVSLSGYGQTGPYALRAGHDANYQALAGSVGLSGLPDGRLAMPGVQLADLSGALYAALLIVAAAHGRRATGRGRFVDLAMAETTHSLLVMPQAESLVAGESAGPAGYTLNGKYVCCNLYRTKDDRYMMLAALEPKFWHEFCRAAQKPHLAEEGYALARAGEAVYDEVAAFFTARSQAECVASFAHHDCCCEPVLTLAEADTHPQFRARGVSQPASGRPTLAPPFHLVPPLSTPDSPPPKLGEHTREVLATAGVTATEFTELAKRGAFGDLFRE